MGFGSFFKNPLAIAGAAVGLPFVGSTLLSGAGSALDYLSARQQNESSEVMARNSMAFSASQAQKQMDFQERMSGTSHQREVEDLKAAGLNPLLSLNQGSSTPGGAAGTGAQGSVVPELSNISSSARDAMRMWNEFRSTKAQVDLAKANEIKTGVDTDLLRKKGPERDLEERFYKFFNGLLDRFGGSSAKSILSPSKAENDWMNQPWHERIFSEYPGTGFDQK